MDFITDFAIEYRAWIVFFHVAGSVIAIGAVTATDLLLLVFKFRPKLINVVAVVAPILSLQVWIGLMFISVSGLLLFLPMKGLENYSIFQFKMLLVAALFLNGIFLNEWVTPKFKELAPEWEQKTKRVKRFMIIAGTATTISFFSWWGVILLMKVFY
ncbi:MAG: hypothetical protein Q8P37_00730 [Candidatus Spechtbacteria bacterium]|nr:hypothetical protein [Candidatus Spechtbacteria bacterium]